MKHRSVNASINRQMMEAFKDGRSVALLASEHRLTEKRVRAILADEHNRLLTSVDPYYRAMRTSSNSSRA
jgi:Mor family transcriptional regulator